MARTRNTLEANPTAVIGYVRLSRENEKGMSLSAQKRAIRDEVARRGWRLVEMIEDNGHSGKSLERPGMIQAREMLRAGEAGTLVVAKLDRATRSTIDAATVLADSQREGWRFVALDIGLDPTTPSGELFATIMTAVAQWERRAIGQRTKDALAEKKAAGVILGRPVTLPQAVRDRIVSARQAGEGWSAIARTLNADGIPTAHGGAKWHPSTVRAVATR